MKQKLYILRKSCRRIIPLLLVFVMAAPVFSQDPSFSGFHFNQLYYNPALCGTSGGMNASLTHRTQWANIYGNYNIQKASVDFDVSSMRKTLKGLGGIGFMITHDESGPYKAFSNASLRNFSIGSAISIRPKDFTLGRNKRSNWNFQFGVYPYLSQKRINWDALIFSDQYNPVNGDFNQGSSFNMQGSDVGKIRFNVSTGVISENKFSTPLGVTYRITYGLAVHHMINKKYFLDEFQSTIPRKYTGHLNVHIEPESELAIVPGVLYEYQYPMQTIYAGTNILYRNLFGGLWVRTGTVNPDAAVFMCGMSINNMYFNSKNPYGRNTMYVSYSYDMTISQLTVGTGGSHEINITYIIPYKGPCDVRQFTDPFKLIIYR